MTETETPTLPPSLQPAEIAAGIAKDAQENLAGLDVVSAGPIFADEMGGGLYLRLYTVLPNRASDDFVVHLITLAHVQTSRNDCRGRSGLSCSSEMSRLV